MRLHSLSYSRPVIVASREANRHRLITLDQEARSRPARIESCERFQRGIELKSAIRCVFRRLDSKGALLRELARPSRILLLLARLIVSPPPPTDRISDPHGYSRSAPFQGVDCA